MLNQSEPNVILTAYATKVNRPEPNWTEPQTCLAGRNHAFNGIFDNLVVANILDHPVVSVATTSELSSPHV